MLSSKLNTLKLFALLLTLSATGLAEKYSNIMSLGDLRTRFSGSDLEVGLYASSSLHGLAMNLKESSEHLWESEISLEFSGITPFCYPASFYKSLPKSSFYIIIEPVHSFEETLVTRCENSKFTSYSIKVDHSSSLEAFSFALTLIASQRENKSKSLILLYSNDGRRLDTEPLSCGDFFYDNNGVCSPCVENCSRCSNSLTCDVCFEGSPGKLSYWKNSLDLCEICDMLECTNCITNDICSSCKPGYTINNEYHCVKCKDKNCKRCDIRVTCNECNEGFYMKGDACVRCEVLGCKSCDSNGCKKCSEYQYFDGSECQRCGLSCIECSDSKNCILCEEGFFADSGLCKPCIQGCKECSNTDTCKTCESQYQLTGNGKCTSCPMFCGICDADSCLECIPGYFYNEIYSRCESCSSGCHKCFSGSDCLLCNEGLLINGGCIPCNEKCELCNYEKCLKCEDSYYSSYKCHPCMLKYCAECSYYICYSCKSGFYLGNNSKLCEYCGHGCESCLDSNNCEYCSDGFYKDKGICKECTVKYCMTCEKDICSQCDHGYVFNDHNLCVPCLTGELVCQSTQTKVCLDRFYLSSEECKTCNNLCELCFDNQSCQKCSENSYFNQESGKCEACGSGCENCFDNNICHRCFDQFYLNNDRICKSCSDGCLKCIDQFICLECAYGFILDNFHRCISCTGHCKKCIGSICDECEFGFTLVNNICIYCPFLCDDCNNIDSCLRCSDGSYLSDSNLCLRCIEGCKFCRNADSCDFCNDGYYMEKNSSTCMPCIENCLKCFDSSSCEYCKESYFVDDSVQNKIECKLCSEGCSHCKIDSCISCLTNYYLSQDNNMCSICNNNCDECYLDGNNALKCNKCAVGFYFYDNQCNSCSNNCIECDLYACYKCRPYYFLSNGKCYNCPENCEECYNSYSCLLCKKAHYFDWIYNMCLCQYKCKSCDDNLVCKGCFDGYYLSDSGKCLSCGNYCLLCDKNGCNSCSYYAYLNTNGGNCIHCNYSCYTCKSATYCTYCHYGYYLQLYDQDNAQCLNCGNYCYSCNDSECKWCATGYYPSKARGCDRCSNYCLSCTTDKLCSSCENYYYLKVYDNENAICEKCPLNCLHCTETECYECLIGFYVENKVCKACMKVCKSCINGSTCVECHFSYFFIETKSICERCMAGCYECSLKQNLSKQFCYYCHELYYLTADGVCQRCPENCIKCNNGGYCTRCKDYYYVSHFDNACYKCKKNCKNCYDGFGCETCESGYYWSAKRLACLFCGYGCKNCDAKGCYRCDQGLFLDSSNNCIDCSYNCNYCSSLDSCYQCNNGYYYNNSENICLACIKNCNNCYGYDCYSCKSGYYLNQVGDLCLKCVDNCIECDEYQCYSCDEGYSLNLQGDECFKCPDNCLSCDELNCNICNPRYFLSEISNECELCSNNCLKCNSEGCSSCLSGYYLFNHICIDCTEDFSYCYINGFTYDYYRSYYKQGYYFDINFLKYKVCGDGCKNCDSDGLCIQCKNGYLINASGSCDKCLENCDSCEVESKCKKCTWNYYLGPQGKCLSCPNYCNGCKDMNKCYSCAEGYFKNDKGTCTKCIENCNTCKNSTMCIECANNLFNTGTNCTKCQAECKSCNIQNICEECLPRYYLKNNLCYPCEDPNCYECTETGCSSCIIGYTIDVNSPICTPCIKNCGACSSQDSCDKCLDTYYLSSDNNNVTSCLPCGGNCKTCSVKNFCESCVQGFYIQDKGVCAKCENNCKECESNSCLICLDGFYVNSRGKCLKCVNKCLTCKDANFCLSCFEGSYLESDGICTNCNNNCAKCKQKGTCDECSKGYFLQIDLSCSKCKKGCENCDDSGICSACRDGFKLLDNICVTCKDSQVEFAFISMNFKNLQITMRSVIDILDFDCQNVVSTNDSFGIGWSCKVNGKVLTVVFGQKFYFDENSLILIDTGKMFNIPCGSITSESVMAKFKKQPSEITGKVKGSEIMYIACSTVNLEYYLDDISGNEDLPIIIKWSAIVEPKNEVVSAYTQNLTETRIEIPGELFNPEDSVIKIIAQISSSMKKSVTSTFLTQLISSKQMNVIIDKGSEFQISSSDVLELSAKKLDSCGFQDKTAYVWSITSSTSKNFKEGQILNTYGIPKLRLEKNFFPAGNIFSITVNATSNSLSGSATIKVTTTLDELKAILNRQDGNISPLLDLTIDGSSSYDPSRTGYELHFNWSCTDPSTKKYCLGADKELLISNQYMATLNIPAARLIGGTELEIHFKIWTLGDSRTSEVIVLLKVIEGLSTNIELTFDNRKIEPSEPFTIKALVTSEVKHTLLWNQTTGPLINNPLNFTTKLYFSPYAFLPGKTYAFDLIAIETDSKNIATSSVTFATNQPAACASKLTSSTLTGIALVDDFKLYIDSCTDLDGEDLPLTYAFAVLPSDLSLIYISKPQSFNSISFKLFKGRFFGLVRVCDKLGGCKWYTMEDALIVRQYSKGSRLSDEDPLVFYKLLVKNNYELTTLYGISVVNTFSLSVDEVNYIYEDTLAYLENEVMDLDSIEMTMNLILQIIIYQNSTLTFNKTAEYTEFVVEMFKNSTENITSDLVEIAENLAVEIVKFGLFDINYIILANDFLDQIASIYAMNMLPGNTIIDSTKSSLMHYKFRETSANYVNKTISLNESITVTIESLPYNSTDVIDINIKSFPGSQGYSDIVDVTFTKCGTYINNDLETEEEVVVSLTTATVLIEIPYLSNITGELVCQYYDGYGWRSDGCELIENVGGMVTMRISHTTMFRLYDSEKDILLDSGSSLTARIFSPPIFLIFSLTIFFSVLFTVCYCLDKNESKYVQKYEQNNEKYQVHATKAKILKYHLILSLFSRDIFFKRTDKILALSFIFAIQFSIQGVFIVFWLFRNNSFIYSAISVLITAPLHIAANSNLRDKFDTKCSYVILFVLIAYAANLGFIVFMAIELTTEYYIWIYSFFWGLLFEIGLGFIVMLIKNIFTKLGDHDVTFDS